MTLMFKYLNDLEKLCSVSTNSVAQINHHTVLGEKVQSIIITHKGKICHSNESVLVLAGRFNKLCENKG